jgi:ADP-L-glycero-D-manno-heptose 6-epimerase
MIAITGAAGFIGSNLAFRLAGQRHDLALVDHPLTPAKAANLIGLPRFRFFEHDTFLDYLRVDCPRLDGIFHLGACSSTTQMDRNYLRRNNVDYTRTLWRWCADNDCPFIYASSAATYGDGSLGFDDRMPADRLRPLNPYGESKNDFDIEVQKILHQGDPTPPGWAGMKFFNVYGPRETHKGSMASVVWHAHRQILETGEVRLFRSNDPAIADGEQRRDFVFVRDCIDHMLWLWDHPEASGIYNSGTGAARTFLDLAHAVFAALDRRPVIRFIDMPMSLSRQYQNFTQADRTKFQAAGYHRAATSLEQGVLATFDWMRDEQRYRRSA